MADPVKEHKKTVEAPEVLDVPQIPEVPSPSASEAEIAAHNQYVKITAAKKGAPTAVLPGGVRIDATPFVRTRTNPRNATKMLGDPESIVGERFKSEHRGWKYMWPVEKSLDTQAMINSHRYKKVPFSAIDKNEYAMVMESPTGDTLWKQHILVAVSPQVWYEEVTSAEHESIRRTALNRASIENDLNNAFGKAGFRGQVEITDVRQER